MDGAGVGERPPVVDVVVATGAVVAGVAVVGSGTPMHAAVPAQRSLLWQKPWSATQAALPPWQSLAQQLHHASLPIAGAGVAVHWSHVKAGGAGTGVGAGVIGCTLAHHDVPRQRKLLLQNELSATHAAWKPPQLRPQQRLWEKQCAEFWVLRKQLPAVLH